VGRGRDAGVVEGLQESLCLRGVGTTYRISRATART
jgi:hypothetical protein